MYIPIYIIENILSESQITADVPEMPADIPLDQYRSYWLRCNALWAHRALYMLLWLPDQEDESNQSRVPQPTTAPDSISILGRSTQFGWVDCGIIGAVATTCTNTTCAKMNRFDTAT